MIKTNRLKKLLLVLPIFLLLNSSLLLTQNVQQVSAAIVDKTHTRLYSIKEDYVEVNETKTTLVSERGFQIPAGSVEGFTVFTPIPGDPGEEEKLKLTLDSVKVTDGDGTAVKFSLDKTDSKNYVVKVTNQNVLRLGQEYKLNLKYNSYGLLINTGAIKDIYIPGFPEDYAFTDSNFAETVTTKISIPTIFPEVNFISPHQEVTLLTDTREINVPTSDLIGNSIWIQLGSKQYFSFEINQHMPKTSNVPFALNTFTLPVPRNINSGPITQEVFYTNISPTPYSVTEDIDGNLLFTFKESASQSHDIKIEGFSTLSQIQNFDLSNSGNLSDIPAGMERYLLPDESGKFWQVTDPKIQSTAKEIILDETNVYKIIQKTYDFVINRIDYSFVKKSGLNERQGALATLNGTAAVCMEYSDLFITLLRAQGVPARAAFGYGFGTSDFESRNENTINHQWAEVYLPKQNTWVNVDTTWGEFGNDLLGGDLNHFYSHVASIDPENPSTSKVSFLGKLDEIPERDMEILIQNGVSNDESTKADNPAELLAQFPIRSSTAETLYTIRMQGKIFDRGIENLANGLNPSDSKSITLIIKTLIYLIPVILVLVFVLNKIRLKRKNAVLEQWYKYQTNNILNPKTVEAVSQTTNTYDQAPNSKQ